VLTEGSNQLKFYAQAGPMTDPGAYADAFAGLPTDIPTLCRIVQGNLIHIFWAERYGREMSEDEKASVNLRRVSHKLKLMSAEREQPFGEARPLDSRQVGNCRDYSLLLTAILRYQGIPARTRCGFGVYFLPDHFEDHWVCEYWDSQTSRWVLVDAQLDVFQQSALDIQFDPLDVPRDQFIVAGRAWHMCREERADPEQFGIMDMKGWWFIWGNVVRDFLALNKIEILPWDHELDIFTHQLDDPFPDDQKELAFYDQIADLTLVPDKYFNDIRRIYIQDPRFKTPTEWIE
jgi:hypothetical protein